MPAPIRIVHTTDPRKDIVGDVGKYLADVKIPPFAVLLAMYERAAGKGGTERRTTGGILLPSAQPTGTLNEDTHQGKVGLVMKLGELAFTDDPDHRWGGFKPAVGDWVAIRVGDSYSFDLPGPRRCRVIEDANVKMIVPDDVFDAIW